jgi:glycosyltransferase involved in cell wall biosynthesis
VHVAALAEGLARRGHDVVVHTRRESPDQAATVTAPAGYRVEHVPAGPARRIPKDDLLGHMPAFADGLVTSWTARRPDVAHAHFWMSGVACLQAAPLIGVPVAMTFHALGRVKQRHQGEADTSPHERIALEQRLCQQVDRVVATCSDEVFELRRMGLATSRVDVVPCGVDLNRFSPDGPLAIPRTGRPRLLAVSRLVPRKGLADAVTALAHIPDAELLVAGGEAGAIGEHARFLVELARTLGVEDRFRLLGPVDRSAMPAVLRSADVLVHVPWYEPFGIVPLEAMAAGRPVVASAVGGLIDTVVDGHTGLLVPPRDPGALAQVIRTLLADRRRQRRMGDAGLVRARRRYGWDRVVAQTESVYRTLASTALAAPTGLEDVR